MTAPRPTTRTRRDNRLAVLPATRGECANVPRPCPFVSCTHHLYLEVSPRTGRRGRVRLNFPHIEPEQLEQLEDSCSLDVADRGPHTLEQIAPLINMTRESVRNTAENATGRLRFALRHWHDTDEDDDQ